MSCIAVIPARGDSKGILRKNLQLVGGQPLVSRCVDTCNKSGIFSRIIVSTDSEEIAAVAATAGADCVIRPKELANDSIMPDPAVGHVIEHLTESGVSIDSFDYTCMLQCTSPLITPDDLRAAWNTVQSSKADCVFAVTEAHSFLWREDDDGVAQPVGHDPSYRLGREALPTTFKEIGAFYFMRTRGFLEARHRFFGQLKVFEIPNERAIDIDSHHDLIVADLLAGLR